jgi:chemotaxis protein MotB
MAEPERQELIIIRRHEEEDHGHHSSAWKVAHADFMTAMMAFFLIMWLINVTDEEVKKSIANYFNPVKLSASVTDRKGLNSPDELSPQGPEYEGIQKTDLEKPGDKVASDGAAAQDTPQPAEQGNEAGESQASSAASHPGDPAASEEVVEGEVISDQAAAERAAFSDPYAVLADLAAKVEKKPKSTPDAVAGEIGDEAIPGSEVYRDPFDPIYWLMEPAETSRTQAQATTDSAEAVPNEGRPDAAAPNEGDPSATASVQPASALAAGATDPAIETKLLDIKRSFDVVAGTPKSEETPQDRDEVLAKALEEKIAAALEQALATEAPHLEVEATSEGILISLTDEMDFSMFEIGSAIPNPIAVIAMDEVANVLAAQSGEIIVRGHTDGRPFRSDTYDNWRLSTARAHMAYYMLTRGELPENRIRKIEGFADRQLKKADDPNAAANRRIEILLKEPVA